MNRYNKEGLDKALCNPLWKDFFPDATVTNLLTLLSDHNPIILQIHPPPIKRKRPYKLESWCLQREEIKHKLNSFDPRRSD